MNWSCKSSIGNIRLFGFFPSSRLKQKKLAKRNILRYEVVIFIFFIFMGIDFLDATSFKKSHKVSWQNKESGCNSKFTNH